ncbi:MAG: fibronectin type III domain-containing protein [Anaerovoracaceae bacterium]
MKIKTIAAVALTAAMAMTSVSFASASTKPVNGTYDVKLNTVANNVYNYKMFCVNHEEDNYAGKLTVKNGKMTVRFRLTGTGFDYLYTGNINGSDSDVTVDESKRVNHEEVTDKDGISSYYYNFPVTKSYIYPIADFKSEVGQALSEDTAEATKIQEAYVKKAPISGHSSKKSSWYGNRALLVYVVKPASTKISKVKAGKKSATVIIKKNTKNTSGYQIRYSKKRSMKGAKTVTITSNKTVKKTVKKLSRGKKYYFQVRTYNQIASKIYSSWSSVKSVKVK